MITIGANGQRIAYGIKHYNLDDESDLQSLPTEKEVMGCTCFVISTSKYYMLNSKKKWVEITPFGQIMSSDGAGDDDMNNNGVPDALENIIYNGGEIK